MASHVQCGDTITQSTTLDSDLIDCPAHGIAVDGSRITLDLGGHVVDGTGGGDGVVTVGDSVSSNVTIRNGTVRQFVFGVRLTYGAGHLVEDLTVANNRAAGVVIGLVSAPTVRRVRAVGNTTGISVNVVTEARIEDNRTYANGAGMGGGYMDDSVIEGNNSHDNAFVGIGFSFSERNRFIGNRVADNGSEGMVLLDTVEASLFVNNRVTGSGADGILLSGESVGPHLLEQNRTDRNGDDGIDVDGPGSTLSRNRADRNGDLGIEAAPGTIDGGKNKAHRNGNPAQCTGVACR